MKLFLTLCIASMMLSSASPAQARPLPWRDNSEQKALIEKVEHYLEGLTTVKADFVQIAPNGETATGKFYLKRPGKMRWQYDPPVPIVMVTMNDYLRYYDYELDQISDIPLEDSIASFLARDDLSFEQKEIEVLEVGKREDLIHIRITMRNAPEEGELTLELYEDPMQLRNLIVKDGRGKQTNISLSGANYGVPLDKNLFVIKDTRLSGKKKR